MLVRLLEINVHKYPILDMIIICKQYPIVVYSWYGADDVANVPRTPLMILMQTKITLDVPTKPNFLISNWHFHE